MNRKGWSVRILIIGLLAMALTTSAVWADGTDQKMFLQFQGGVGFPASTNDRTLNVYDMGLNGEVMVGYWIAPQISLGLESGYDNIPGKAVGIGISDKNGYLGRGTITAASVNHIPLVLIAQVNLAPNDAPVKHYLMVGLGVDFDFLGSTVVSYGGTTSYPEAGTIWVNPEIDPGLGVAFSLGNNTNLFFQSKLEMTFPASQESFDNPIMSIPIQTGLNFSI